MTFMNCSYSRGTLEKLGWAVANYERQIRSYFFMLWIREGLYFHLLSYDSVYELVESIDIFLYCLEPLLYLCPFGLEVSLQLVDVPDDHGQFLERLFYSQKIITFLLLRLEFLSFLVLPALESFLSIGVNIPVHIRDESLTLAATAGALVVVQLPTSGHMYSLNSRLEVK